MGALQKYVILAEAGIQRGGGWLHIPYELDSGFRQNDEYDS